MYNIHHTILVGIIIYNTLLQQKKNVLFTVVFMCHITLKLVHKVMSSNSTTQYLSDKYLHLLFCVYH